MANKNTYSVSLASGQDFGLPINCHIAMDSEGMDRALLSYGEICYKDIGTQSILV